MDYLSKIKTVFSQTAINISERIKCVDLSFETTSLPEYNALLELVHSFPSRDNIKISFSDVSDERIIFGNRDNILSEDNYNKYLSEIDTSEVIEITITIEKEIINNNFSIYCFDSFLNDICSLSLFDLLAAFANLLNGLEQLRFIIYDKPYTFMSKTMSFSGEEDFVFSTDISRLERLQLCHDISRFSCAKKLDLIPEDFKIVVDTPNNPITKLFEKLYTLLSIVYICTTASLDNEKIFAQITGQRSISYEIDINAINKNEHLYKIYNWIFTEGNSTDKSIIARNVISLHCRYTNLIEIDDMAFASIQSNYSLYLRNNVNQYLELKNKVAEYICDVVAKTGDYATTILDRFKQNLIALVGFLLTTILANIVSSNPLDNIFTKDITILVYAILIGSVIFLVLSIIETNYKVKTIEKSYFSLKENYIETLSNDDIAEIFKNDKMYNDVKREIKHKTIWLSILWSFAIVLSFFIIEYLSEAPVLIDHIPNWFSYLKGLIK
ncbi:MAG: hypothetical protein IKB08_09850 [Clostridia bacterium]|nr:hypothetical protein [Clostridia bacterium]